MNLFVAKLAYQTTEDQLRTLFEQYGTVDSVRIIFDRDENRSKGFGFVEMSDDNEAQQAIEALDQAEVDGRTIVVKKAEPKPEGGGGRGGFGGGGGGRGGYSGGGNRGGGGGGYGGGGGGGYGGGGNRGGGGGYGGGGNRGGGGGYGGGGGGGYKRGRDDDYRSSKSFDDYED